MNEAWRRSIAAPVSAARRKDMYMVETVYNLFLIYQDDVCAEVRYVAHDVDFGDQEALAYLLNRVALDLNNSKVIPLTKPFTKDEYDARTRLGHGQICGKRSTFFSKQANSP
jgi:hypothetical protein